MDNVLFEFYRSALSGGIANPLCAEYKTAWRKCGDSKEKLIRLAMCQQAIPFVAEYARRDNSLTKEYLKEEFKDYINGYKLHDCDGVGGYTYGMYVDWDYGNDIDVDVDVCNIMWTKDATVVIPTSKCPTIYINNGSKVRLVCDGYNAINIKLFDESELVIEDCDETCEIIVHKYSKDAKVEQGKFCFGDVRTFEKQLRL